MKRKYISLLLIMLLVFSFGSCGEQSAQDNDNTKKTSSSTSYHQKDESYKEDVVGTWEIYGLGETIEEATVTDPESFKSDRFEFSESGTCKNWYDGASAAEVYSWEIDGKQIKIRYSSETTLTGYIDGDTLVLDWNDAYFAFYHRVDSSAETEKEESSSKTESSLKDSMDTVMGMNANLTKAAEANIEGYEGLYTDDALTFTAKCGSNNKDIVTIAYADTNGEFIPNTSSTIPSSIVMLQLLPSGDASMDTIDRVLAAIFSSTCDVDYQDVLDQIADLSEQVTGSFEEGETKESSDTICGAKVTMGVMFSDGTYTVTVNVIP